MVLGIHVDAAGEGRTQLNIASCTVSHGLMVGILHICESN